MLLFSLEVSSLKKKTIFITAVFFICSCRPGDSSDHERGDGSEDESTGFQPEEHAPRSSADESTLPPKHSEVLYGLHSFNEGRCHQRATTFFLNCY